MIYALITTDSILVRIQDHDDTPPAQAPEKGVRWVDFVEIAAQPVTTQVVDGYDDALEGSAWVRRYKVRELTYVERRQSVAPHYAPLPEQLDMQYKDAQDGGTRWVDHIAAVKAAHPKPVA